MPTHRKWRAKRRDERRALAYDLLGGRCVVCGYNTDMDGLEIDHIEPLRRDGSNGFQFNSSRWWMYRWERVVEELAKCQLLCGTCHRIKTRQEARRTNGWRDD